MKTNLLVLPLCLAFCLSGCLHRMDIEKIGKIKAITAELPLTIDAVVADQTTWWDLELRRVNVSLADTSALSTTRISLYLENIGSAPLRAFTSESLLDDVPHKQVRFDLLPGGKVLVFQGIASNLIRYGRNIRFLAASGPKPYAKLRVRFHFVSAASIKLDGEIVVRVLNYDSI